MRSTIKNNLRHWRIFPRGIALFISLGILSEAVAMYIMPIGKDIVDMLIAKSPRDTIVPLIIIIAILGCIDAIANRVSRTTKDYLQSKLRGNLQIQYYSKLLTKEYRRLSSIGTGNIQSKMEKGIDAEVSIFVDMLVVIISIFVRGTALITIFFLYLPRINAVFVVLGILVVIIHAILLPRIKRMQDRLSQIGDDAAAHTTKIAMEHHTITLHTKQSQEIQKLETIRQEHPRLSRQTDFINEVGFLIMSIGFRCVDALGYFLMGGAILTSGMTVGTMIMILMYINWMWRPISTVLQQMSNRRKNIVRSTRMHDLLTQQNLMNEGSEKLQTPIDDIVFESVHFGYHSDKYISLANNEEGEETTNLSKNNDTRKNTQNDTKSATLLFQGLSLTIPAGKTTAFVGRSGSGKTSIVKLLLRLYDPDQGSIMIGNQDLRTLDRNDRYDNIGYLSQEPGIFDGTVRENLMYGITTNHEKVVSDDELQQSLDYACIGDRVRQFDKGLDEALGEKGIKLSGGEKQRLAIARLFLRQPEIIIMDEPSAALDSESEHTITESLKKLFANKTTIIIAHRLQTVMHADQIIVMEQGKIIEQGTHSSLVAQGGNYSQLINLQNGTIGE